MSYSIRKATVVLSGTDPSDELLARLRKFPLLSFTHELPNDAEPYMTVRPLSFSGGGKELTLEYEFVDSPGPRLYFFGFVLDIPSGRLLMGDFHGEESPSVFDLYRYLEEEMGFPVNPQALAKELELWKTGQLLLFEALYRSSLAPPAQVRGSTVRRLLGGSLKVNERPEFTEFQANLARDKIVDITAALNDACNIIRDRIVYPGMASTGVASPVKLQSVLGKADELAPSGTDYDIRELFLAFTTRSTFSLKNYTEIDKKTLKKGTRDYIIAKELMVSLPKTTILASDLKKSEITAMSMLDLIRSSKIEDAYYDAVSDIADDRNDSQEIKKLLNRLIDDSGVRNVLTGGVMSAVGRAMVRHGPITYLATDVDPRTMWSGEHYKMYGTPRGAKFWESAIRFLGRVHKHIALVYTQ